MRPPTSPDLVSDITLISSLQRGRRTGWRPNHDFGLTYMGDRMFNDAHIEFVDCQEVQPGQTVRAEMWLLAPELQTGRLTAGFEFTVHEGNALVARGVVVSVLRKSLQTIA